MPWCQPCERYFNPASLSPDGTCPVCGAEADLPEADLPGAGELSTEDLRTPWHFRLAVVATAGYVGWRIVQLVAGI